jgi:hypothetical protein
MIRKGENEMKQYTTPDMLILTMGSADVITTSGVRTNKGDVPDPSKVIDSLDF